MAVSSSFSHSNMFMASKSKLNSRRYTATTVATLRVPPSRSYWSSIDSDIDAFLKAAIPIRSPESVFDPMHHLAFAAPRTTAPALCVASGELLGGDRTPAIMAAASAIHLIHAAAYTHQHLPSAAKCHATKPVRHKYGPNIELLIGDGILPFGMELVARSMDLDLNNQDRILKVIIEISRAAGSQGLMDGIYQELEISEQVEHLAEIIEDACVKKEGKLHACGAACGAILGGGTEEEIEKLRKFGLYVGIVQGLLARKNKLGGMEMKMERKAKKYKESAMKELEIGFQDGKRSIEEIGSIVEATVGFA